MKVLFDIDAEKINSLYISENSYMFSGAKPKSIDEFLEAWNKKITLNAKKEVKFDEINTISREADELEFTIKHKGIIGSTVFSFLDKEDIEEFEFQVEKQLFLKKEISKKSPFKAIQNYLIGFIIAVGGTGFLFWLANAIANGEAERPTGRKSGWINLLIDTLGPYGILALGAVISMFMLYKIWTRYNNPPEQVVFSK